VPVPTVVLLHGQPDSSASFWSLRRQLRSRLDPAIRITAPDRPGYGANPRPVSDFRGNVDWLKSWLRSIDAGPTVVVGHSWAGGIGVLAGASVPSVLAGLVLVSSIGPYCLLPIDSVLGAPLIGEIIAFTTLRLGGPLIRHSAATTIRAHLLPADVPYAKASGFAMAHRPLWRTFLQEQRTLIRDLDDISAALPSVGVATLVVDGTDDQLIPGRTPTELSRQIPGARRVRIAGAHDLQLKQPAELAGHIADFVTPLLTGGDRLVGEAAETAETTGPIGTVGS
jgi:pimeloyl-ACP methyl ester carboxylesterase